MAIDVGVEDDGAGQVAAPGDIVALDAACGVEDRHAIKHPPLRLQDVAREGGGVGGDDRGRAEIFWMTGMSGDAFHAERLTGICGVIQKLCLYLRFRSDTQTVYR